jgi:hypothetical protein
VSKFEEGTALLEAARRVNDACDCTIVSIVQLKEHRSSDCRSGVPKGSFAHKVEQLYQPPNPRFVREVPTGNN